MLHLCSHSTIYKRNYTQPWQHVAIFLRGINYRTAVLQYILSNYKLLSQHSKSNTMNYCVFHTSPQVHPGHISPRVRPLTPKVLANCQTRDYNVRSSTSGVHAYGFTTYAITMYDRVHLVYIRMGLPLTRLQCTIKYIWGTSIWVYHLRDYKVRSSTSGAHPYGFTTYAITMYYRVHLGHIHMGLPLTRLQCTIEYIWGTSIWVYHLRDFM